MGVNNDIFWSEIVSGFFFFFLVFIMSLSQTDMQVLVCSLVF